MYAALVLAAVMFATAMLAGTAQGAALPFGAKIGVCEGSAPCREFDAARGEDLARVLGAAVRKPRETTVILRLPPGRIELERTWVLDGGDLPAGLRELRIEADPEAGSVLSGSIELARAARSQNDAGGRWVVQLAPGVLRGPGVWGYSRDSAAYPLLFDREGPLRLARWPNSGWSHLEGRTVLESGAASVHEVRVVDAARAARWAEERHAWLSTFPRWDWHDDALPLRSVRSTSGVLELAGATPYPFGGSNRRFALMNARSELDSPGEFHFDPDAQRIEVLPRGERSELRLSRLEEPLLRLQGVRRVTLSGLGFAETRGDALVIAKSEDVAVVNPRIHDAGRRGIVVDGGRQVRVTGADIERTGQNAAVIGGGDRATLTASGHLFESSRVRRAGEVYLTRQPAVFISGVGVTLRGLTIEECPQGAIQFEGNEHLIEANRIDRVVLESADAGAIYSGRDWTWRGNVIRRNLISHVRSSVQQRGANGVYLDDMLSGTRVESNLFFDVDRGVLVGGGRDNVVIDNLFVGVDIPLHVDERGLGWAAYFVAPGGVLRKRLAAVPYQSALWSAAYPGLRTLPGEEPGAPAGNVLKGNAVVDSGASNIVERAIRTGQIEQGAVITGPIRSTDLASFLADCRKFAPCAARLPVVSDSGAGRP